MLTITKNAKGFLEETGKFSAFASRFFSQALRRPFEWKEMVHQCYVIGYQSLFLVATTGFIMGIVLTLQLRPTMLKFGASSFMPDMISIAFIREIGPVLTALICSGKIGSSIGAELGSMKVTEQIDAMEVSGTNPFKFLVVTRVWACIIMLPILVVAADTVGLIGSYMIESNKGEVSFVLYFERVFGALTIGDIIPAFIKSFFFGLVIGLVGCYKGYNSAKGTAGVGKAANSAVVLASLLLFVVDFLAVLIADIFFVI